MSNTGLLSPDPLETILHRLNGTVLQFTKLRISLHDIETELRQIREQCEIAICTRTPAFSSANKPHIMVDTDGDTTMQGLLSHDTHGLGMSPGSISVQDSRRRPITKKRKLSKQEGNGPISKPERDPESSPARKSARLSMKSESKTVPRGSSSLQIFGSSGPSSRSVVKMQAQGGAALFLARRHAIQATPEQISFPRPPRPPIDPSSFPKHINLSSYPFGLRREGHDWFVLFNPSPKVKRVLNMTVVHTLWPGLGVGCVKFSQDAKWIATGCCEAAEIYDIKTGKRTCVLDHGNTVVVWSLCFSPDGKYLVTGAEDGQITVWNVAEKRIHRTFEGHKGHVSSVHFSADGLFIVSGSGDGTVRIWDVRDRTFRVLPIDDHYLPHSHNHGVWSIALSPDGKYIVVGSANTVVSIWEVTTGVLVQRLRGHRATVCCVAFTPDGKELISGSHDETLKYWDVTGLGDGTASSSPPLMNLSDHKNLVTSTAVSHDGIWVVSGSEDGSVLFWYARTGVVQCMLSGHKDGITYVDFSPLGNFFATASWDGQVRIWRYDVIE